MMVDFVVSPDERQMLTSSLTAQKGVPLGKKIVSYMLFNIENKVFAAMRVVDGKTSNSCRPTLKNH